MDARGPGAPCNSLREAGRGVQRVLAWAAGNDILISIRWLLLAWIRRAVNAAGKTGSTVEEHAAVLDAVGGEVAAACGGVDAALLDSAAIRVLD